MAFKYNDLGQLIATDPKAAWERLAAVFSEQSGNVTKVAAVLGVNRLTVKRWLKRLAEQGFPDPRPWNDGA